MSDYSDFLTMLSTEFQRYLIENEEFAEKIPANAMVIFQIEGEDDFNRWHKETSLRNKESEQPVIFVYVKKWRKHSSLEELNLSTVSA
ncbi:MAG: DUF5647 family protein [Nitrospirota bacterium]